MKKVLFLLACTALIATVDAKAKVFNDSPRIISLDDLSFERIQEVIHSKNSDFTLELREGTTLPLRFLVKNPIFSAMVDPNLVFRAEKTCYLRIVNKKCYMSEDLIHWEKAGKFANGETSTQLRPNTHKPGFTVETNIAPYEAENS